MADPLLRPRGRTPRASSRFLELLRRDEPDATVVLHVDPPDLRQAAVPARRRGAPGRAGRRERHHEVRDRAAPPAVPRAVRAPRRARCASPTCTGPRQRLRDDFQGFLPDLHAARARRRADHGVRRRRAGARLPLRRRRRRVPAARGALAPTRRARCSTSGTTSTCRCARSPTRSSPPPDRVGSRRVPWPPDRDAIDIGSYFGDSSKAKRMLGWEPRTPVRRRASRARVAFYRVTPLVVPVTDDPTSPHPGRRPRAARRPRSNPSSRTAVDRGRALRAVPARARDSRRSRRSSPRSPAGATRSAVASGTDALRLALVALGVGAGRRGDRARVHRGADRGGGVRGGCGAGVRRRRPRHRDARPERAAAPRSPSAPGRSIPVHLYGRPAAIPDLGVPVLEDAAQAHGALDPRRRSAAAAYSFYPTKNLGGIGDGGAVVTDDDDARGDASALLRAHGLDRRLRRTTAVADELAAVRGRGRRAAGRSASARRRRTRAGARSRARYREAAPDLRWQAPHPRHVYHLCVARVADRDGVPRAGAVRDRRALPAGAHPAARVPRSSCATPCPEAEAWAAECVSFPCFPEMTDDEIEAVCRALR